MQSVTSARLSVEEFYQQRHELPEHGRWCELVQGQIVDLDVPDPIHSGVVLNIAKALGAYAHRTGTGYACFDIGLVVARTPDTVRLANIAYYLKGPRFAFSDAAYSETAPELMITVASSTQRRESMPQRVSECLAAGVEVVWVLDPNVRVVRVHRAASQKTVPASETLHGDPTLPGFACDVGPLFDVPQW